MMRRLSFWGTAVLTYVVVFWIVGCADSLILHPSREPIDPLGARLGWIETPTGKVQTWTVLTDAARRQGAEAFVLECIPNAGRAEYAWAGAAQWADLPVEYVAFNYPGYGGSEGKATLAGVHQSSLAAYDALAARAGGKPIFVSGMSLGTPAALHVAANRPVAGVVLQNPVPLRQLILGRFG
jgi:hypothetical protein